MYFSSELLGMVELTFLVGWLFPGVSWFLRKEFHQESMNYQSFRSIGKTVIRFTLLDTISSINGRILIYLSKILNCTILSANSVNFVKFPEFYIFLLSESLQRFAQPAKLEKSCLSLLLLLLLTKSSRKQFFSIFFCVRLK